MTDVVHRYLRLGLRLGRLEDGLVETYFGPDEPARRVRISSWRNRSGSP